MAHSLSFTPPPKGYSIGLHDVVQNVGVTQCSGRQFQFQRFLSMSQSHSFWARKAILLNKPKVF